MNLDSKRLLPETYLLARDIQKRLLSGPIPESEVRPIFSSLSKQLVSPQGLIALEKVNNFYETYCYHPDNKAELLRDSDEIASKHLINLSPVIAVLPAGQFYCDMYDPLNRRFLALMDLADHKIDEYTFLRRDLPDYDFLSVFEISGDNRWPLISTPSSDRELFFKNILLEDNSWIKITNQLLKDFSNKIFPVGALKFTGGLDERITTISDFVTSNKIALCFSNHIPLQLWNHMDLLIKRDDYCLLSCIRDLTIGIQPPIIYRKKISMDIPLRFQINYLLQLLSDHSKLDQEGVLRLVFKNIRKSMPDRPFHGASLGLINYSRKHWKKAIKNAQNQGLIESVDGLNYSLNHKGQQKLEYILNQRQLFLNQKYLTGNNSNKRQRYI